MVQGHTTHKGLSPSRFMTYIPVSQSTHAGHTQSKSTGHCLAFPVDLSRLQEQNNSTLLIPVPVKRGTIMWLPYIK